MSKTFVLHISWVDFFLLFALVSFNLWRRYSFGFFFSVRLTSNHDWLWTVTATKTKRNAHMSLKSNKSVFFSLEMNYLSSVYILAIVDIIQRKNKKKIKIKIPENGRRTPHFYRLHINCSIYFVRWFLFPSLFSLFVPFLFINYIDIFICCY